MSHEAEGKVLREFRATQGLTQRKLAKMFGWTSPQFISNCERELCGLPTSAIGVISKKFGAHEAKQFAWAKIHDFKNEVFRHVKQ